MGETSAKHDDVVDADTYPLLMEHHNSSSSASLAAPPAVDHVSLDVAESTIDNAEPPASSSTSTPSSSSSSSRNSRIYGGSRQRISPLNSGLWISIELTITVSQIVASIIVLSLSRDEKPQAPLSVWVAGYAAGCLATLPLLYWRYTHRNGSHLEQQQQQQQQQQDDSAAQSATPSTSSPPPSPGDASYAVFSRLTSEVRSQGRTRSSSTTSSANVGRMVEKFKIALDCFFAVWFVVGNVWIFGGHSSSREAPNLYRLCIVFLTFSCIGYAMPFILCATICCCLPCIIALLGFREEQTQNRGAPEEVITALPTYKFKSKSSKEAKDGSESDSEGSVEGGIVGAGTDKERPVSADDAVCCICLAKYKDSEPLRELPCTHHFHVNCVDKWLKINSSCPLCKLDINSGGSTNDQTNSSNNTSGEPWIP